LTDHKDLTGTRLGNYRLIRLLGRGRMGVVYLAQDEALLRPTAVKVLSWAFLESRGERPEAWFLAEARSVARINHPAVVQVYSVAKHGNDCYIAMEYVEGVSGDARVRRDGPLSPMDATQVILQIAGALHQAHGCNIIHRDVKPANVLIKSNGTAKLGDFGMALHTASAAAGTPAPMGTPHYIAPEIWQGAPATPLTDLYALGATYFYFLTGRPPFDSADLRALINAHLQSPIPDPRTIVPAVPSECARILRKCLAKSPVERYPSAQELDWELRGMLRSLDGRAPTPVPVPTAGKERTTRSEKDRQSPPSFVSTHEPWVTALGLALRPFATVDGRKVPYQGQPMRGIRDLVVASVRDQPGRTLILTGARGCGRSVLARQCLAEAPEKTPISYLDLKSGESHLKAGSALPRWACSALGAVPSTSSGSDVYLDGLIEHLATSPRPAMLVMDSVPEEPRFIDRLSVLVRAAYGTRSMTLLVVGSADFAARLASVAKLEPDAIITLAMPALDPLQTVAYLTSWLEVARSPGVPPLMVTADAAMVAFHRSQGNLGRINTLATNFLRMAAFDQRRVVPSWYAWMAPMAEDWRPEEATDLRKPAGWPSQEVLTVLNACREQSGMPRRRHPE